jgi:hypothetical protein
MYALRDSLSDNLNQIELCEEGLAEGRGPLNILLQGRETEMRSWPEDIVMAGYAEQR